MKYFLNLTAFLTVAASVVPIGPAQVAPPIGLHLDTNVFRLPDERTIPWKPGIPGGIPYYLTAVNVKNAPFNARGDGVADDYSAITNAIAHCTNGGAVYFPAGTYKLSSELTITKSIVLRGAGSNLTRLVCYDGNYPSHRAAIRILGGTSTTTAVTNGFTRGSSRLYLNSESGFASGKYIRIFQDNDPAVVIGTVPSFSVPYQGQILRITSIDRNIISIDRPLYYTYSAFFNPKIQIIDAVRSAGIEDLSVEMMGTMPSNIDLVFAAGCWVTRVESINVANTTGGGTHIGGDYVYQSEISHNFLHKCREPLTRGYNNVYGVALSSMSTDCLVVDNILDEVYQGVVFQNGACGNVGAYNYMWRGYGTDYPNDSSLKYSFSVHGGAANFNLFEGNVGSRITADNFWGCNYRNTFLRNWVTRYSLNGSGNPIPFNKIAVEVNATNYYNNFIGNIICRPNDLYDTNDSGRLVWDIGKDIRNQAAALDPNTEATTIRHGNFDFVANATSWRNNQIQILPPSMYLTAKPSWFGGLPWPPIGPDVNTSSSITNAPVIPAQARFWGIGY